MPAVQSKEMPSTLKSLISHLFGGPKRKIFSSSVVLIALYLVKIRFTKPADLSVKIDPSKIKAKNNRGNVDSVFFKRMSELLKIVIPNWKCVEVKDLVLLTAFLVARTFLSIYISTVQGRIVKSIISLKWEDFLKTIGSLALCAVPASFINSYLDFLNKRLAIHFRTRLTTYFNQRYIKDMVYYQMSNLDSRIPNPDQRLTQDIEKWAISLSNLYSNFTKPILDIVLFSRKLAEILGWKGPIIVYAWYFFCGVFMRFISPSFGKLTAIEQQLEGDYRGCHNDLVHHSEEIAFYRGHDWEKKRISDSFKNLITHSRSIVQKRLYMGVFDNFLVKYGAVMCGYAILGMPVFGSGREAYLAKVGNEASAITRDYIRNSALLINLAKGIGRLVVSYKEIQLLAGYTTLVTDLRKVLDDLEKQQFVSASLSEITKQKGEIIPAENIKFDAVPVYTPNGDLLVQDLSFEIGAGMNCIVTGPNGCGKSSLFRILGSLWPIFGGKLYRPSLDKMFYIPQRPYLPPGNLRDQIIYPHTKLQMLRKRGKDEDIKEILKAVRLEYLIEREGGFDAINDWNDVLSGGEKQRMAMGRLFYHKPQFAILDECTSAVSMDVEADLYHHCKKLGITLFTVSHRQTLFRFHDYNIKFDGEKNWSFNKIQHE